jgi:hypothetical protein
MMAKKTKKVEQSPRLNSADEKALDKIWKNERRRNASSTSKRQQPSGARTSKKKK